MKICELCRARFKGNPTVCPLDGGKLINLPDPLIGRTISGRYLISEKIGAGGMGTVYRALHEVLGRDVALKFLAPDLATDANHRQRFLREAKAANRINHEHIIDITDFGQTDDGLVYLVMEYLDGAPLSDAIIAGRMKPHRGLSIALQISQALARAHELDVVHRDIKPDNIYLLSGYQGDFVKILDFGLAQMKGELRLTATGTVFGTPEYMAPEQARGAPCTHSVDLYALGCVLYEMLTGQLPFTGNQGELILQHIRATPEPPSRLVPGMSEGVDALVMRLLSKDASERPTNAYQLAEEIKALLDLLGGRTAPHRVRGSLRPNKKGFTETAVTDDAWHDRVDVFRSLIPMAHPSGDVPKWLPPAIDQLSRRLEDMTKMRRELDHLAEAASAREVEMKEARLRIGRAVDELGRDESRVLQQVKELEPRRDEARTRLTELERPLLKAWGEVPPMPAAQPRATRELVDALRDAGHLASIWIEAERSVTALERDLEDRRREHEDLRFQIAQLKGRLGTHNAESDMDLGDLRGRTSTLDTQIQALVDELMREAEPVYRHYMEFPELRNAVISGDVKAARPVA